MSDRPEIKRAACSRRKFNHVAIAAADLSHEGRGPGRLDRVETVIYDTGEAPGEWCVILNGYGSDSLAATLAAARGLSLGAP